MTIECYYDIKTVVELWCCHGVDTVDGETIFNRMTEINVEYSIQSIVSLNRDHCRKESHSLSKHAISKIVFATEGYRRTPKWFKVNIVEVVSLYCNASETQSDKLNATCRLRSWFEKVGCDIRWHMIQLFFMKFYYEEAHTALTIWNDTVNSLANFIIKVPLYHYSLIISDCS